MSVLLVDLHSGRLIHELPVFQVAEPEPVDPTTSYASPSPVIDERHVYVHFGTYGTACIARTNAKPFSTPLLVEHVGRWQLISTATGAVFGYLYRFGDK